MPETLHATLSAAGVILFMIIIFFGAYYASRLVARGALRNQSAGIPMKVLSRTTIGRDQALVVVQIGEKALLLGVTSQQITQLGEFDPAQFETQEIPMQSPDFMTVLREAWQKQKHTSSKGDKH